MTNLLPLTGWTVRRIASLALPLASINLHAQQPTGEIRGQLLHMEIADTPVPPAN